MWILTLLFTCGSIMSGTACANPSASVGAYPTRPACISAGLKWTAPAANPTHTVKSTACTYAAR